MSVKTSSYRMEEELRLRLRSHLLRKNMEISEWITMKALEELNAPAHTYKIGDFVYKADAPEFVGNERIAPTEEQQKKYGGIAPPQIMLIDRSGGGWLQRMFGFEKVRDNCVVRRD